MTAAYSTLKFSDDPATNTYNILNASGVPSNYQLAYGDWSPQVATKTTVLLSGQSVYQPVLETMTINVVSTVSPADCIQKLRLLINFLDQAERWYNNEAVDGILVYYQPKGSNLTTPLRSRVLANATDPKALAQLPVTYDDVGTIYRINGVVISFWRAGLWLDAINVGTDFASLASTANGSVSAISTLASNTGVASPCDLSISPAFNSTTQPNAIPSSVLMIADAYASLGASRMVSVRASNMASGVYTSIADAGNKPKYATILRYTPGSTAYVDSGRATFTGLGAVNTIAIYATVRNNGTTSYRVKVRVYNNATTTSYVETQEVLIAAGSTNPRVVFLGILSIGSAFSHIGVSIAATAAASTLDIDNIVCVGIDDEGTSILEFPAFNIANDIGSGAQTVSLLHNTGDLSTPTYSRQPLNPTVIMGTNIPFGVLGRLPIVSRLDGKTVCWLMTQANFWTFCDNGGTIVSMAGTFTRQRAYLIPE